MPDTDIARPLNPSQAQAARRYIKNMYDQLLNDLSQFAADQEADVERAVNDEHIEAIEYERDVQTRVRRAKDQLTYALEAIAADARLHGFPEARVLHESNYMRVDLRAAPLQVEVDRRKRQIRSARDRAFLRIQQARLAAEKTILLASMTPEVESVINTIPSAQELFRTSLAEIVR